MPPVPARLLALAGLVAVLCAACNAPIDPARPPLRVGVSADYAPFAFRADDGSDIGLDVDVARRFARDTGRRLELVRFRWPDLLNDLQHGAFDIAMSGVTMRPERALVGTFTRPMATSGVVALARLGLASDPQDVDRQGIRLGVNRGGHMERMARRLFPKALLTTVDDNMELPVHLRAGDVDAIVCDRFEAARWRAALLPNARLLGPLTVDHKAYLAREPGLAAELDAWLRAREADGSLAELRTQWLGPNDAGHRTALESDVDALLGLIDLRLAFMPWVAQAKLSANRPIVDAAQEEDVLAFAREEAAANGLSRRSAVGLFNALIVAARNIQSSYAALPPDRRTPVESVDLVRTLRPAIREVSRAIIRRASDTAREPAVVAEFPPKALADLLDPNLTASADRRRIAEAILALSPDSDRSAGPTDR